MTKNKQEICQKNKTYGGEGALLLPHIMAYYKINVFNIVNRVTQETDLLIYDRGSFQLKKRLDNSVTGGELLGLYLTQNTEINSSIYMRRVSLYFITCQENIIIGLS